MQFPGFIGRLLSALFLTTLCGIAGFVTCLLTIGLELPPTLPQTARTVGSAMAGFGLDFGAPMILRTIFEMIGMAFGGH